MSDDLVGDLGGQYLDQRGKALAQENDPVAWLNRTAQQAQPQKVLRINMAGGGPEFEDADFGSGDDPLARAAGGSPPTATGEGFRGGEGDGSKVGKTIGRAARDVAVGVAGEGAASLARGAAEGMEQLFTTADELASWVNESVVDTRIGDKAAADANAPTKAIASQFKALKEAIPEARTNTGHAIGVVGQFLASGAVVGKLAKAAGVPANRITRIIKDAFTGAAGFDPEEARLADTVQNVAPNMLTEFLQAKDDDGVLEKRLKAGLEMAGLGAMAETVIKSLKVGKAWKQGRAAEAGQQAADRPAVAMMAEDGATKQRAMDFLEGKTSDAPVAVNMERFGGPEDIRAAIADLARGLPKGDAVPMAQTLAQAEKMGLTPQALAEGLNGKLFSKEQISAGWMLFSSMAAETQRLAVAARTSGAPEDLARYLAAYDLSYAVLRTVKGQSSEIARALQIHNAIRQKQPDMVKNFQAMLEQQGGADQALAMAERMASMTPEAAKEMIRLGGGATMRDKVAYAYANTLLSNPASLVANIGDTGGSIFLSVPETWLASKFGDDVLAGEASARLFGILWSFRDGFGMAARAWQSGESAFANASRFEHRSLMTTSRDLSAGEGRKFGDYMALLMPTRLMMAGDEFTKSMAYRGEMFQLAYREVRGQGLEGPAAAAQMGRLLNSPPEWLRSAAEEAAIRGTFNQQLGPTMQRFASGIDKMNVPIPGTTIELPVGRVLFPFIRTPANLERWVIHRTPAAYLSPAIAEQLAAGGASAQLAQARIVAGSAVASMVASYVMNGQITGQGPKDSAQRAALMRTGWQPYSVRFTPDGPWYSYARSGTFGTLIGHAADATEMLSGVYTRDAKAIDIDGEPVEDGIAAAVIMPFASAVKDKTFLQTASRLIDALSDPHRRADTFLEQLASSVVPAGVGAVERTVDPELRRAKGYLEALQAKIPGVSDSLPPKLNLWGEPIKDENGLWNLFVPVRTSEQKGTAIDKELVRMRLAIQPPAQVQSFGRGGVPLSIKLSPEQHNDLIRLAGNDLKLPSPNGGVPIGARDLLDQMVAGGAGMLARQYKVAGDERREVMIKAVLARYREAAKARLIQQEPDLQDLIRGELDERAKTLRTPREQQGGIGDLTAPKFTTAYGIRG